MPRKNHSRGRRQHRRVPVGQSLPRALREAAGPLPTQPIEKMVLPTGRCHFRSRYGKLIFKTEKLAQAALEQAKTKRKYQANGHVESRYYACPPGGCGGFHLTSRDNYEERPQR